MNKITDNIMDFVEAGGTGKQLAHAIVESTEEIEEPEKFIGDLIETIREAFERAVMESNPIPDWIPVRSFYVKDTNITLYKRDVAGVTAK